MPQLTAPDKIKFLTVSEIQRFLRVINSVRDRALFTIAYYHGMRVSEIGLLKERDYNKESKQLIISRLKNGRIRAHDMKETEIKYLNAWMSIRGLHGDDTCIFLSRQGRVISRRQLDTLMKQYGQLAELPKDKCHFHVLRHSCAVHMIEQDIPVIKVRDWLGHRYLESTLVYANVSDKALSDTANQWHDKLDEIEGKRKKEVRTKINWKGDKK